MAEPLFYVISEISAYYKHELINRIFYLTPLSQSTTATLAQSSFKVTPTRLYAAIR